MGPKVSSLNTTNAVRWSLSYLFHVWCSLSLSYALHASIRGARFTMCALKVAIVGSVDKKKKIEEKIICWLLNSSGYRAFQLEGCKFRCDGYYTIFKSMINGINFCILH